MADGDRPIVLVPLATARKAARRAGVTLNLSAEDIQLAGKWKHGWIPLDAVASAVKAKRYHGGGGRTVKGKGRAGSAVEARREPSRGRTKGALPTRGRTFSDAGDTTVSRREHGLPTGGRKAAKANPVGSKLEHSEPRYVTPGVAKSDVGSAKSLNLPSGYEVRRDRVQVASGVTQSGSSFSAYGPDGRRVHHAARSESEAARMARKHHERATEGERQRLEAAAARSAATEVKQREQSAWDARMAAGTARHKVTTDAIAERRKAEPILLRIRAGMLSKDDLTALADDPSAGRYERVAAHRALTALASRRLATATPAQLDQIESVAASAKGLAPSERDAFLRASAARRRKLKRGGR